MPNPGGITTNYTGLQTQPSGMELNDPDYLDAMAPTGGMYGTNSGQSYGLDPTLSSDLESVDPQQDFTLNHAINGHGTGVTQGQAAQGILSLGATTGDVINGYSQMQAAQAQSNFLSIESQVNLQRGIMTAGTILGPEESFELGQIGQKGEATMGAQRAIYAGQGVNVNAGSAAEVQKQTKQETLAGEYNQRVQDALKAYGITTEATQESGQQGLQALGLSNQSKQSMELGASQAYEQLASTYSEEMRNKAYFGGGV